MFIIYKNRSLIYLFLVFFSIEELKFRWKKIIWCIEWACGEYYG